MGVEGASACCVLVCVPSLLSVELLFRCRLCGGCAVVLTVPYCCSVGILLICMERLCLLLSELAVRRTNRGAQDMKEKVAGRERTMKVDDEVRSRCEKRGN